MASNSPRVASDRSLLASSTARWVAASFAVVVALAAVAAASVVSSPSEETIWWVSGFGREVETPEAYTLAPGARRFVDDQMVAENPKEVAPAAPNWTEVVIQTPQGPVTKMYDANSTDPMGTLTDIGPAPAKAPLVQNTLGGKSETSFQTSRAQAASDQWDEIIERGRAADVTLSDANTMNFLIDQVDYTGFGGETLLAAQKLGRMIGLDVGKDVPAKEAMQRLTAKLGLSLKADLPGPMSDGDRQFLLSIPPNLTVTRAGNKALVFMSRKRAQFDSDMARSLTEANPQSFEEYKSWENEFRRNYPPLFDEASMRDLQLALSGDLDG